MMPTVLVGQPCNRMNVCHEQPKHTTDGETLPSALMVWTLPNRWPPPIDMPRPQCGQTMAAPTSFVGPNSHRIHVPGVQHTG